MPTIRSVIRRTEALLLLALSGCAPVYLPSAANVPTLVRRHETHVSGQLVPAGVQLNAAHALTDRVALKATGHWTESEHKNSRYKLGTAGVVYKLTDPDREFLVGTGSFEAGGGSAVGKLELGSTKIVHRGDFFRAAVQGDIARLWTKGALGAGFRLVYFRLKHDSLSRVPGLAEVFWFGEPFGFVRLGPPKLRVEAQLGVSVPFYKSDLNVSGFVPVALGLGLSTNF